MDIIIKGYLKRFVEEFGLDKNENDVNFEKLCYYTILNNELNHLDDNDLDEISIGKNKGIDGICFAIDGRIITNMSEIEDLRDAERNFDASIYFIQAKTSSKFSDSEIANFCDTTIDFLSAKPKYTLTPKAKEYHDIYLELLKLLSFLKSFNCKLFYCSAGLWRKDKTCSTTLSIKKEQLVKNGNFKDDDVEIIAVDNEKLRKLYDKATKPLNTEFTFAQKTTLKEIDHVKESYIGILPFDEFRKIIIDKDTEKLKPLFSDNV